MRMVERLAVVVVVFVFVVVASAGCGILNGLSTGDIQSPFQQDPAEGEGEDAGEVEAVAFEERTTPAGVPFKVAIPEGYGETRFAVIFVAAVEPCLPDPLTSSLYDDDMAIVHVPVAGLTAARLTDVFDTLERDIALDDSQTFAVVAGAASRLLDGTRVGNEASPGLMLLSPVLPAPDPELRSSNTTIFATVTDTAATTIAATTGWSVVRVRGVADGCAMLTQTTVGDDEIAGEQLRDLLLARPDD
jgi:hypothetical protein